METTKEKTSWGKVLICGNTSWDTIKRKAKTSDDNKDLRLLGPHLIRELVDISVSKAVTGPTACHSVIISQEGEAWVFGRNAQGQLGMGHSNAVEFPVNVRSHLSNESVLENEKIIDAAVGRSHTILVTESGQLYAAGENKCGQLGLSDLKNYLSFHKIVSLSREKITQVACGSNFTLALNDKGEVYAFGSQEYGQLGNGTNGEYLKSAGRLLSSPQIRPCIINALKNKTITSLACGTNHSLALDNEGFVYSWGFGGYGRLGHNEQKDLYVPTAITAFAGHSPVTRASAIACGTTCSMALDGLHQLLLWGKWKLSGSGSTGQPWMHPRYVHDLNGWSLSGLSAGDQSLFAIASEEKTTIGWGQVQNGELGFGEERESMSSSIPQKIDPLKDIITLSISAGSGHTLLIVVSDGDKVMELPKWPEGPEVDENCLHCHKQDNGDKLLLCDKCDISVHTYCAKPPLDTIPEGEWYCDVCHPPIKKEQRKKEDSLTTDQKSKKRRMK
ncbi:regulator of chromosome condensation 1/beta-lactamase-inhibitor protein II [Spinellus fusiger]|nr:regulator of chromosome condensation 1/beta-lactamase-inhibitor protein II [Spinellus fusiger]